jgi:hypothetical protein
LELAEFLSSSPPNQLSQNPAQYVENISRRKVWYKTLLFPDKKWEKILIIYLFPS